MTDERHDDDLETSPWATDQIPPAVAPVGWDALFSVPPEPQPNPDVDTTATPADGMAADTRRWKWLAAAGGAALIAAVAVVVLTPGSATGGFVADSQPAARPSPDAGADAGIGGQPVATPIEFSVDPVANIGIDIVIVGQPGGMTHLDLDGRAASRWGAPDLPANQNPQLFADATRVLAVSGNGGKAFVSGFGRATELDIVVPLVPPFLPGPTNSTVWARSPTASLDVESQLINLNAESVDSWVRLAVDDAVLLGGDGSGGLLLATGGDVYTSAGGDPSGFTTGLNRLTTGEVLAVGRGHAIVRECDVARRCTTSRLVRGTRELTTIDGFPFTGVEAADGRRDVSLIGSVSPDGGVALVRFDAGTSNGDAAAELWTLFDIDAGVATSLGPPSQGQPMIWNDDSSYAVFASNDELFVYERATATIIEVEGIGDVGGVTGVDEAFSFAVADPGQR